MINRQVVLIERPAGIAQAEHFEIRDVPVSKLNKGQILVRNIFLSVEPAMRGWIADVANYSAPVPLGEPMRALAVGEIVESHDPAYRSGEFVTGWFGWQTYALVTASAVVRRVTEMDLPLSLSLGVLGINGVTAHLALTMIGEPLTGETVLVSTAAGSVGSAVGQIAKIIGCRTIGITGGSAKVELCRGIFGYDEAIDYKSDDIAAEIDRTCNSGIDIFFDNTAGAISDAVYPRLAMRARVVNCGTASISTWTPWPEGPRVERHLLVKRARMQGFVVFDHQRLWDQSVAQLAEWVRQDRLHYVEEVLDGIEMCAGALAGLYRGENMGKRLIKL